LILDIQTEKGQRSVQQEAEAIKLFSKNAKEWDYFHTSKSGISIVDGLLFKDGILDGIVEVKCRSCDEDTFKNKWDNEWLITYDKIDKGRNCAKLLHVPLYGFLYLTPDKLLMMIKISDESGQFVCRFRVDKTRTQKTTNGGSAKRNNAFISMQNAKEYKQD
jgi:hypothetical protein